MTHPEPVVQDSGVPEVEQAAAQLRAFHDLIAQAIGDPGSIVGRRLGPSWGVGQPGYSEKDETVTRWSARAVMSVIADSLPVADVQRAVLDEVDKLRRHILIWMPNPDGRRGANARLDRIEQWARGDQR